MQPTVQPQQAEALLYKKTAAADRYPASVAAAQAYCEGYKRYLDEGKTEREACQASVRRLRAAGYLPYQPGRRYAPGEKVYAAHRGKCVLAATIGSLPVEQGLRISVAHIDSPRLDLRPVPLYESTSKASADPQLTYLRTHYYGGVRKYQWPSIPLALHGVVYRADGTCAELHIGEGPDDPVFCITDLLPHLGAEQNKKPLREAITAEDLNVLVGSLPLEQLDAGTRGRVKLHVLTLLNQAYGITEEDLVRAEVEVVPAFHARDVGLDRSLVGGYGQDDRVEAYAILMAEIETHAPARTTVCVLTDKEETGSNGVTGMNSAYAYDFMEQLCEAQGARAGQVFAASQCLSADVAAAFDPNYADAFVLSNSAYAGDGMAICKYTGSGGKSNASDASAELVSWLTGLLDRNGVAWQMAEMGRIDLGGGGTVSKFVANRGIDTIDIGVPVLSMHAPFELVSKSDAYMLYRAALAFNNEPTAPVTDPPAGQEG